MSLTNVVSKQHLFMQARSQDLEKGGGGYFERLRKVLTALTRISIVLESVSDGLSENWDEISRKTRKFPPKWGGLQKKKKKKGLHRIWDWFFGRNLKFKGFFRPKSGGLQKIKKKKRSSPKLGVIFRPNSEIQTLEGAVFLRGGAIFNFSQQTALKSTKNVRFCILHKPMGGGSSPPPLATLLCSWLVGVHKETKSSAKQTCVFFGQWHR